ncbi:MAG: DUF3105 domain-containing protein [bacterium]
MLIAAALLLAGGYFFFGGGGPAPGRSVPLQGNRHIRPGADRSFRYNTDPPTSGPHYSSRAPWGIHDRPLSKGLQLHSLEDGGVAVQYNCSGCPELVLKLRAIVRRYRERVILAPYPTMKTRIALTAWGRIDSMEDFDEARIVRFIDAYRGIDHHR